MVTCTVIRNPYRPGNTTYPVLYVLEARRDCVRLDIYISILSLSRCGVSCYNYCHSINNFIIANYWYVSTPPPPPSCSPQ